MKQFSLIFIALAFALASCSSGSQELGDGEIRFTRDDFKERKNLENPEEIVFEELLYPTVCTLFHDTLVVAGNQTVCPYFIEIYSLKERRLLAQLAPKGGGPGEFQSYCYPRIDSNHQSDFYVSDGREYYEIDFDSTLASRRLIIRDRFPLNPGLHPNTQIGLLDDNRYVGYNFFYFEEPGYSNKVPALKIYNVNDEFDNSELDALSIDGIGKHNYFAGTVNYATLFVNPGNKQIWWADGQKPEIKIYNDTLAWLKTLRGPDDYDIKYTEIRNQLPIPMLIFASNKDYKSCSGYTYNDKHIYIIYQGVAGADYDENMKKFKPVEIFKLDWDGNLLCCYKVDRYLRNISVDSREEYLYGTAIGAIDEDVCFVKYKL